MLGVGGGYGHVGTYGHGGRDGEFRVKGIPGCDSNHNIRFSSSASFFFSCEISLILICLIPIGPRPEQNLLVPAQQNLLAVAH